MKPDGSLPASGSSDAARRERMANVFRERFAGEPVCWVRAPGRVDLMGSHTDYNLGRVLTLAIDRDTWVAGAPRADGQVRVFSLDLEQLAGFEVSAADTAVSGWEAYVGGMVAVLGRAGFGSSGFDAVVHGTVPLASGLSSSASLTVAMGQLVQRMEGHTIEPLHLARLCQQAENDVVGVPCGLLDPCSSLLGRAGHSMLLDCRSLAWEHVPISESLGVVVADTRVPRTLAGSKYAERRAECEAGVERLRVALPGIESLRDVGSEAFERHRGALSGRVARRCGFVIAEDARVQPMAAALARGDRQQIRELCERSFAGARDDYGICVPAMEAMFAALSGTPGCVGARQAGAGFGGCLVGVVERDDVGSVLEHAARRFAESWGAAGGFFEVRSAAGAGILAEGG